MAKPISTAGHDPDPQHPSYTYTHQSLILPASPLTTSPRVRSASRPPLSFNPPTASDTSSRPQHHRLPYSQYPSKRSMPQSRPDMTASSSHGGSSYAAIYEAALDVARAAERASHRKTNGPGQQRWSSHAGPEVDARAMLGSFHSEVSAQSSSTVAADEDRRMSQSTGALLDGRGRTAKRVVAVVPTILAEIEGSPAEMTHTSHTKSRSLSFVRGSGGRGRGRGRSAAGVAFMSLGLLIGWGRYSVQPGALHDGMVLRSRAVTDAQARSIGDFLSFHPLATPSSTFVMLADHPVVPQLPGDMPLFQRVVGRVAAWICTTLYLTSRLPQIWMNVRLAHFLVVSSR